MSHNRKSKDKGVSASSFFDLKAELLKQEQELTIQKAAGQNKAIVGGVTRPNKKPTVWSKANKGVKERHDRDLEQEALDRPTQESIRANMERKAKKYEKLRRGKTGGLSDAQLDNLLVDFDAKTISDKSDSDTDDVDESLHVPKPPVDADDEIVEYIDDLGRSHYVPKSEVPREYMKKPDEEEIDENIVIYNPVNHLPTYTPDAERRAQIEKDFDESNNPLSSHYDYNKENRARGAAAYVFAKDEQTREAERDALQAQRLETQKARAEAGAIDVKPGEVEGFDPEAGATKSRASEKRKREMEERRKLLDAKRKKAKPTDDDSQSKPQEQQPTVFMATADDPFAALEAASSTAKPAPANNKGKETSVNAADAFLAQLETDMFKKRGK